MSRRRPLNLPPPAPELDVRAPEKHQVDGVEKIIRDGVVAKSKDVRRTLQKAFQVFDTDGSGFVGPDEFRRAVRGYANGIEDDVIRALFDRYDADRNGQLSIAEVTEMLLGEGAGAGGVRTRPGKGPQRAPPSTPPRAESWDNIFPRPTSSPGQPYDKEKLILTSVPKRDIPDEVCDRVSISASSSACMFCVPYNY
jgi:hypothetical protein